MSYYITFHCIIASIGFAYLILENGNIVCVTISNSHILQVVYLGNYIGSMKNSVVVLFIFAHSNE